MRFLSVDKIDIGSVQCAEKDAASFYNLNFVGQNTQLSVTVSQNFIFEFQIFKISKIKGFSVKRNGASMKTLEM